ncbi:phytanoyl-CoA dioxygenase family protein [Paenibacillus gansuensis]|uniref:Phytanoyl-CoA dioxygenase family protein n=1 Tax=Paenibacillus gansuensis TaxID=306542 RepID=A0ABW5PML3_9BACL
MTLKGMTEEQFMMWNRDGYLVLPDFLSDTEVSEANRRMDEAFRRFKEQGRDNPETAKLSNVEQLSGIIEHDELFLELMEHPRMMGFIRDVMGDSFVMIDNDALIKPPKKAAHTNWHRDTDIRYERSEKPSPFMVKIFYFLSDVSYEGGCLALLPGSVHMPDAILPKVDVQEDMPAHVRMNVRAGTAVLFHGYLYHSALNNHTEHTRRSLIYNYGPSFLRTWPGYEPSEELRLRSSSASNLRRMLLGMTPWIEDPKAFQD